MEEIWVLVPLTALAIPLAGVVGHVVVKPIVEAISRLSEAQASARAVQPPPEGQLLRLEERLGALEHTLGRIEEEQEFQRRLLGSRAEEVRARPQP